MEEREFLTVWGSHIECTSEIGLLMVSSENHWENEVLAPYYEGGIK
jgi:hypothetical protein